MRTAKSNGNGNTVNHNVVNVVDMIVENGMNFGTSHIKLMNTVTIYENGDYVTEQNFYINGYKFRMDDLMRHSIKRYLLEEVPKYQSEKEIDRVLNERVNCKIGGDAPQFVKIRMRQQTTLIRGLIKALRVSKNLKGDLTQIFGETEWDKVFDINDFNGQLVCNWKNEWKKDYSTPKYRLQ